MENQIRFETIKMKLRRLKNKDNKFKVPGASKHRYESEKIEEKEIFVHEQGLGVILPSEYKAFLKGIGTGAGPGYGILSLTESRIVFKKWENDFGSRGDFSGTFNFSNQVAEEFLLARKNFQAYRKLSLQSLDGMIPICHYGGTNYVYLVVSGEGEGRVWSLNTDGYETVPLGNQAGFYFFDWIENWLDSHMGQDGEDPLANFYQEYLKRMQASEKEPEILTQKKLFFLKETYAFFQETDLEDHEIEWLSFGNCGLQNLPDKLFKMKGLLGLDLEFNNLSGIYSSLRNLRELKYLSLSHNDFKNIPETIKHLKSLRILDASYNHIESIADFLGELESLQYVNLSNNRVKEIHPAVAKLQKLMQLDLSNNKGVFGLNSLISMQNLKILNLSGCGLVTFPFYLTMMQRLEKLYLTGNGFNRLPREIQNLKELKVLTLNESLVENLDETLDIVAAFPKLEEIYIPYVDLFKLPSNMMQLKHLKKMTLYPALQNRGKVSDKELLLEFLKRFRGVFAQSTVDLIY